MARFGQHRQDLASLGAVQSLLKLARTAAKDSADPEKDLLQASTPFRFSDE